MGLYVKELRAMSGAWQALNECYLLTMLFLLFHLIYHFFSENSAI